MQLQASKYYGRISQALTETLSIEGSVIAQFVLILVVIVLFPTELFTDHARLVTDIH